MSEVVTKTYPLCFETEFKDIKSVRFINKMGDIGGAYGMTIFFGEGNKDEYAAWIGAWVLDKNNVWRYMCTKPTDKYYFEIASLLGKYYGNMAVYNDLFSIFLCAGSDIQQSVISFINNLALKYDGEYHVWALNLFLHVYYGMVAEEHYPGTKLGKTIKMNGLYEMLIDGKSIEDAADCYRRADWEAIKASCDKHHIYRVYIDTDIVKEMIP